jgi:hypothetical protein
MPLPLRKRIASDFAASADDVIKNRLDITGQLMNIGGPEEFAASIDDQRAKLASFAKMLGIKPLQ